MIRKPWGSEQIIFEAGEARVKLLRVKPGKRLSLQYHKEKREAMMLISGFATMELGKETIEMIPGGIYSVPEGVTHRISAYVPDPYHKAHAHPAIILEMAHGSDEDIVRLADDFGRETTTATQPAGGQ